MDDLKELKSRYDQFAATLDYNTTACDFHLRELEIDTASEYMSDGDRVLDVGCGLGYAVVQYAARHRVEAQGIDYSGKMVEGAQKLLAENQPELKGSATFQEATVLSLPYPDQHFHVVTSSRCIMALLDWDRQKEALVEIHRVLKPGGTLVLMEGTLDGLERLNVVREKFGLDKIAADGRDRLFTRKIREAELLEFCQSYYELLRTQRFGTYYFLSRVVQPLLVAPDPPRYDHKLNEVARRIAKEYPDFEGLGHLVAFVFRKREDGNAA